MRSQSSTISTPPHAHSSVTREFSYAPTSSRTSSLRSHHAPSSRETSSTQFHYAPLSSTTFLSHSLHHPPPSSPSSKPTSSHSYSSDHTSRPGYPVTTSSLTSPYTTTGPAQSLAPIDTLPPGPSVGLTIAVPVLIALLLTAAVAIWLVEVQGQGQPKRTGHKQESRVESQPEFISGPVGLGISLYPTAKETNSLGREVNALSWFDRVMERLVNFAVFRSRTELGSDAGENLLLPIQKDKRAESNTSRYQVDTELESIRGC